MQLNLNSIIGRGSDVVFTVVNENAMMMNVNSGEYFDFGAIASDIWEKIDEPVTVETLCDSLMEDFDVDKEICQRDVLEFLSELAAHELIVVS